MGAEHSAEDSVARVVARLRDGGATSSVLRSADRVMLRAEPTARAACRAVAASLPPPEIDELVQDALELVWTKLPEFHPDGPPFEAWVWGIATNVGHNARRRRRDLLTEDGVIEATEPAHSVLREMQRAQRDALIIDAIDTGLDGTEQDVLYHRYFHGLTREQIAELMGLASADAVRVVLIRARRHLKEQIVKRLQELGHSVSLLHSDIE